MSNSCRCILLHVRELSEHKKILECFSEEFGRIGLVINTNKQIIPDYFRLISLEFTGGTGLKTLQSYQYTQKFISLDATKQVAALYFNELLFYLTKQNDPHEWLLPFYLVSLAKLNSENSIELILREFEYELLSKIGFLINFDQDVEGLPINTDYWYRFCPLKGFERLNQQVKYSVNGSMIFQLKQKNWQINPNNKIIKYILTSQIKMILDGKILNSKALWPKKLTINKVIK